MQPKQQKHSQFSVGYCQWYICRRHRFKLRQYNHYLMLSNTLPSFTLHSIDQRVLDSEFLYPSFFILLFLAVSSFHTHSLSCSIRSKSTHSFLLVTVRSIYVIYIASNYTNINTTYCYQTHHLALLCTQLTKEF